MRRHAFTLIEMLLVVAIIALLISLLLPSFVAAKENTRRGVCASNLHQMVVALDHYVQAFRRKYPGGNATLSPGYGIDSSYVVPTAAPMGLAFLITQGFCPTPQIFYCPSSTHPFMQYDVIDLAGKDIHHPAGYMGGWPAQGKPGPSAHRGFSYHYRSTFGPATNRPPSLIRSSPSASAITTDQFVRREVLYGLDYGHKQGSNVMFMDGRVSWKSDPNTQYMYTMQPPAGGLTNGNWAYQEIIWQQFFDK